MDVATFIDFLNKPEVASQILPDKPRVQFRKKSKLCCYVQYIYIYFFSIATNE